MIKTLQNSKMGFAIAQSFQEWYKNEYEKKSNIPKSHPLLCQIMNIKSIGSGELLELWITDSKIIFIAKIHRLTFSQCCDKVNSNLKKDILCMKGSIVSIGNITFQKVQTQNGRKYEIQILEISYIDGLGIKIINDIFLQNKQPILIREENQELPHKEIFKDIFNKITQKENEKYQKEIEQNKINNNNQPCINQIQITQELIYDAQQFQNEHFLEQQFKSNFKFIPYTALKLSSRNLKQKQ